MNRKRIFILVTVVLVLAVFIGATVFWAREQLCVARSNLDHELYSALGIEQEEPGLADVLPDALLFGSLVTAFFGPVISFLSFGIYKIVDSRNPVPFVVTMIVLFVLGVVFVAIDSYIKKAKAAQTVVNVHAPVIYLYPERETEVDVELSLSGELTYTYPTYESGWNVTAYPSGTLVDADGEEYPFLFWEAEMYFEPDLSHGFCVPGSETEEFLSAAVSELGLSSSEASAFVAYWTPKMEDNAYNVICFQTDCFDEAAELEISPAPDVLLRVNMVWYPSDEYVDIPSQDLSSMGLPLSAREGFTVVEWGGEMYGE